jgi:rod shape-determining protein MreD
MGLVRFATALALAVFVHMVGLKVWPTLSLAINPFVVLLAFYALRAGPLAGLATGVLVGIIEDSLSGGLFGLHGCADTVVGFSLAAVAQRVVIDRTTGVFLAATAASSVQQGILICLELLLFADPEVPDLLWVVAQALSCGLFTAVCFSGLGQWRARYESWRRYRGSRLHFH